MGSGWRAYDEDELELLLLEDDEDDELLLLDEESLEEEDDELDVSAQIEEGVVVSSVPKLTVSLNGPLDFPYLVTRI